MLTGENRENLLRLKLIAGEGMREGMIHKLKRE